MIRRILLWEKLWRVERWRKWWCRSSGPSSLVCGRISCKVAINWSHVYDVQIPVQELCVCGFERWKLHRDHPVKNLNRACESCSFSEEDFGDGFKRPLGDIMDQLLVRTYNQPKARNVHNPHGGDKSMRSCIVCDCKGFQWTQPTIRTQPRLG